jgi:DnaJ-class molecular chaperone
VRVQPWSPDPDKYADECRECDGMGCEPIEPIIKCVACSGTGIVVDWETVEAALLGRQV